MKSKRLNLVDVSEGAEMFNTLFLELDVDFLHLVQLRSFIKLFIDKGKGRGTEYAGGYEEFNNTCTVNSRANYEN